MTVANLNYTNSQTAYTSFFMVLQFAVTVRVSVCGKFDHLLTEKRFPTLSIALNAHKTSITSHWV
jgi:hypothetical protein